MGHFQLSVLLLSFAVECGYDLTAGILCLNLCSCSQVIVEPSLESRVHFDLDKREVGLRLAFERTRTIKMVLLAATLFLPSSSCVFTLSLSCP